MGALSESEWDIAAFEAELGVRLPRSLRSFLLGGDPLARPVFAVSAEARIVERFYTLGEPDPMYDLSVRHHALQGIVPPHLLAIARDDRRDLVCIGITGRRRGALYLIRIPPAIHVALPARLLAPSLGAFLDQARVAA